MEKDDLADDKAAFSVCEEAESDNREAALEDLKFGRLGEQWPEYAVNSRGKDRPMLTLNRMPAFVRQVTNDARQNKPSIKVHPADSQADVKTAEVINGLVRNIEYISNADVAYDTAIDFAASMGFGYIGVDLDYSCDDTFDLDINIRRIADPFSIYGDPYSDAADSSDWNTAFETEVFQEAEFKIRYPEAQFQSWDKSGKDKKEASWFPDGGMRVAKRWIREKVKKNLLQLSDGRVMYEEMYTKPDPETGIAPKDMAQVVKQRPTESHKVSWRVVTALEEIDRDDWLGKFIPIIPVYGEEINVQGTRIFKSLIRDAKDAQRMFNFWRTASTELVALAPKAPWVGPKGAFKTDVDKWTTANTMNHAYMEYDGNTAPQRQPFAGIPAGALQEAMNAQDDMKSIMGLFDASLGQKSNETSGRAIIARQKEGDVSTFHFQDNMTRAIRHTGRVVIDLIPHVYNDQRIVRVMGEDKTPQTVPINQQFEGPDGAQQIYDLTVGKYDLTVATGPSFSTRREEAAFQMTEVMRAIPAAGPVIGPHLAKNLDWPGADEIAEDLKLLSPVTQIREQQEMKKQGIQPPPDPELVKQEQQMKMEQAKGQNDIMLSREKMKLQQEQSQLDAMIRITEHKAEMQMMGEKHAMTIQQGKEKAMQDMHGKTVDALNAPEGEDVKHPLVMLLEALVQSNAQVAQSNAANAQSMQHLAVAVAANANAPRVVEMQTSQGKTITAVSKPVLQ